MRQADLPRSLGLQRNVRAGLQPEPRLIGLAAGKRPAIIAATRIC